MGLCLQVVIQINRRYIKKAKIIWGNTTKLNNEDYKI